MIDLGPNMPMSKNFHFGDVEFANLAKFQVTKLNVHIDGQIRSDYQNWSNLKRLPPNQFRRAAIATLSRAGMQ